MPASAISSPLKRPRLCLICRIALRPTSTAGIPVGNPQRIQEMRPRMRASLACSVVIAAGIGRPGSMPCPGGMGRTPGADVWVDGVKGLPQLLQNLAPGELTEPHFVQVTYPPRSGYSLEPADRVPSSLWAGRIRAWPAPSARCLAASRRRVARTSPHLRSPR